MTPLQLLLSEKKIPLKRIVEKTDKTRTTIWRWEKGILFPHPIDDVPHLLDLFGELGLTLQGCYPETHDFTNVSDEREQGAIDEQD